MKRTNPWTVLAVIIILGELIVGGYGISRGMLSGSAPSTPPVIGTAQLNEARVAFRATLIDVRTKGIEATFVDHGTVIVAAHRLSRAIGYPAGVIPNQNVTDPRVANVLAEVHSELMSLSQFVQSNHGRNGMPIGESEIFHRMIDAERGGAPQGPTVNVHGLIIAYAWGALLALLFSVACILRRNDRNVVSDLYLNRVTVLKATLLGPLGAFYFLFLGKGHVVQQHTLFAKRATELLRARKEFVYDWNDAKDLARLTPAEIASIWNAINVETGLARLDALRAAIASLQGLPSILAPVGRRLAASASSALSAALSSNSASHEGESTPSIDEMLRDPSRIAQLASILTPCTSAPRSAFILGRGVSFATSVAFLLLALFRTSSALAQEVPAGPTFSLFGYGQMLTYSGGDPQLQLLDLQPRVDHGALSLRSELFVSSSRIDLNKLFVVGTISPTLELSAGKKLVPTGYIMNPPNTRNIISCCGGGGEPGAQLGIELHATSAQGGITNDVRVGVFDIDSSMQTADDRQLNLRASRDGMLGGRLLAAVNARTMLSGARNDILGVDGNVCEGNVCLNAGGNLTRTADGTAAYGFLFPYVKWAAGKVKGTAFAMAETTNAQRVGLDTTITPNLRVRMEQRFERWRDAGRYLQLQFSFQF